MQTGYIRSILILSCALVLSASLSFAGMVANTTIPGTGTATETIKKEKIHRKPVVTNKTVSGTSDLVLSSVYAQRSEHGIVLFGVSVSHRDGGMGWIYQGNQVPFFIYSYGKKIASGTAPFDRSTGQMTRNHPARTAMTIPLDRRSRFEVVIDPLNTFPEKTRTIIAARSNCSPGRK